MKKLLVLTITFIMLVGCCTTVAFGADMETPGYAKGIAGVYSSGNESGNVVEQIFDGEIGTKWAHDANPSVVWFKTDPSVTYDHVSIALTNGHLRHYNLELAVLTADGNWEIVWDMEKTSSGTTDQLERFDFSKPISGEWLRFTGQGSDVNLWNNISEMTGVPLQEGPSGLVLFGTDWAQDLTIVDVDGQSYLPFIPVAEYADYAVEWDEANQTVNAVKESNGYSFKGRVGDVNYETQEGSFTIEKPLTMIDGTLMVPVDSLDEFISYNCTLTESSHTYGINFQRATKEILAALDEMSSLVTVEGQMELYASLYDPATQAMYFGQGAVGREGFGPGIEPTAQAGISSVLKRDPEKLRKLGEWVQGLQDPATGWFMEPEYTIDSQGDGKKQRNLQMGLAILNGCGMEPLYLTPTQRVQQAQASGTTAAAATTEEASDADKAIAEADAKYQSLEAYMNYVRTEFDWDGTGVGKSAWQAGNDIGDITNTLKELGYLDEVSAFIRSKQNPETGLFGKNVDINGISGVTKLSGMFTATGTPMAYMDKIIESAAWLAENTEFTTVVEPYNITLAIRFMVNSAGAAGLDETTQQQLTEASPRFIYGISGAMSRFVKDDGGFGYSMGGPCTHSQGALVLPAGLDCADVNGNQLALGVVNDLFWLMGMNTPSYRDEDLWWELIKDKEPITEPLLEMPGTQGYDFENVEIGGKIKGIGRNNTIEDPVNWHNQCLMVNMPQGMSIAGSDNVGEEKSAVNFSIMLGDIRKHGTGLFMSQLGNSLQLTGSAGSGTLSLYLRRHGTDGIGEVIASGMQPWQWYDIRLEYYPKGNGDTVTMCYVNGKYSGKSTRYLGSHIPTVMPNKDITGFSFNAFLNTDADFYVDNISFEADWE